MSTSLIDLSSTQMLAGLRSGAFSSRELTQAVLDRIHAVDPQVRAYLSLAPEQALVQASQADAQLTAARKSGADKLPAL